MADNFVSINQPPQGGVPQFQQEQVISSGTGQTVSQLAAVGSSIFESAAKASAASQKQEAQTAQDTALGGLQQKLLNIRQAGETSNIDVVREQRKVMSKFNSEFPALRTDASKMFKAETGQAPSAASPEEVAEQKLALEAISNGYGRHNASVEHNEEQLELYIQTKRADKQNAARLQELNLLKTRGDMSKEIVRTEVLGSFREMSGLAYKKAVGDAQSLITATGDGTMSVEEANLSIRKQRIDINRAVASLGEYATEEQVQAYIQPILDELQLAEDVVNGVIEREATKNIIATNKARAQAIFFSEPNRVNLVVISELFGHTVGFTNKMTAPAYRFLSGGLTKEGMVPTLPRPVDPTDLDDDSKAGIKGTTKNAVNSNDPKSQQEVSAMLSGVAEHLNRNGMDYDAEDKDFVIDLLNTPKAMALLSPEQKDSVMIGFEMYIVDDTKVAADKYILNAPPITVSAPFPRVLGGGAKDTRKMVEVADIVVREGRIYWTVKPEFANNGKVQQIVRTTNSHISEEIIPVINILSEGSGKSFEDVAGRIALGTVEEEEEEESTKVEGEEQEPGRT